MTIVTNPNVVDLPQYLNFDDEQTERRYQELFNLILTQWFNSNGFFQPTLSSVQAASILAMVPSALAGTHWYNSDLGGVQFVGNLGKAQTQSTLTNAQVVTLLALPNPPTAGTVWYNSDLDKMQFVGAGNVARTITST